MVELTGLAIMQIMASGQLRAQASARVATMVAFVLKRSSRVMPGFLGTPAGITTTSQPSRAAPSWSGPMWPVTWARVSMWLRSAATPGVWAMSYSERWLTSGLFFSSRDSGWPMPPDAPSTATLAWLWDDVDRLRATATHLVGLTARENILEALVCSYFSVKMVEFNVPV